MANAVVADNANAQEKAPLYEDSMEGVLTESVDRHRNDVLQRIQSFIRMSRQEIDQSLKPGKLSNADSAAYRIIQYHRWSAALDYVHANREEEKDSREAAGQRLTSAYLKFLKYAQTIDLPSELKRARENGNILEEQAILLVMDSLYKGGKNDVRNYFAEHGASNIR